MKWYHSVLDPEAKVIYNDKGEVLIRDPQLRKDFFSNTWLHEPDKKQKPINERKIHKINGIKFYLDDGK